MNQIAHRVETPVTEVPRDAMVSMLERVLMDPSVPVERLERLLELQDRERQRQAKISFFAAMAAMQSELPTIDEKGGIKNSAGKTQSTYAKWADINEAIMPALKQHGFSLTFKIATAEKITITGILSHMEGHSEDTSITLQADTSGSKNAVQAVASSISYGKRYTAGALLNITSRAKEDADDNGRAAGGEALISEDQVMELRDIIREAERDEKAFCKRLGIEALADIYAAKFGDAKRIALAAGTRR